MSKSEMTRSLRRGRRANPLFPEELHAFLASQFARDASLRQRDQVFDGARLWVANEGSDSVQYILVYKREN